MVETKYAISKEFYRGLLSLILIDPGFGIRVVDALDPALIGYKAYSVIFSVMKSYVLREGKLPSRKTFRQLLLGVFHSGSISEKVWRVCSEVYNKSRRAKAVSREDAKVILTDAILDVELMFRLDEGYKLYRERRYDDVFESFEIARHKVNLLSVGSMGCKFQDEMAEYLQQIKDGAANVDRIPIGIGPLDAILKGGLGRGELGCILGAEKDGKSMALNHIAATAVLLGLTVVYISAELGELVLKNRYTANVTGLRIDALEDGGQDIAWRAGKLLRRVYKKTGGEIIFKVFPPKSATVRDIESYLRDIKRFWNVDPDVVIVDYADELIATRSNKSSDSTSTYLEMGTIYSELRALGSAPDEVTGTKGGFDCAIWTASQVQRSAIGKEILEFKDVADSILKAAKVDLMVGLCRNEDEIEADIVRLYVAACRYAPGNQEVGPYARDYVHGRLVRFDRTVKRFEEETWLKRKKQQQSPQRKSGRRKYPKLPTWNRKNPKTKLWTPQNRLCPSKIRIGSLRGGQNLTTSSSRLRAAGLATNSLENVV